MAIPVTNYKVGQQLRNIANVNSFPAELAEQIVPSIIVNPDDYPAWVQQSIPKPNSKQRVRCGQIQISGGVGTDYQIASNTSTIKISYLGSVIGTNAATATGITLWDEISGSAPSFTINTLFTDTFLLSASVPATSGALYNYPVPMPLAVSKGIRLNAGGAGVGLLIYVYYLEETI